MTRFLVFLIAAYIVYYLIKNSLKQAKKKNTSQDRKKYEKKKKEDNADTPVVHVKEIAYVYYSATKDGDSCDACRAIDGRHLLPHHKMLSELRPPLKHCKSKKGCRCSLVYVTRDEEDSRNIEFILQRYGGMCDRQSIERELKR